MPIKNVRLPITFKVKSELAFTDDPNSTQKSVTILKDSATAVQNAVLLGKILEINSIKNLSNYNVWCAIDFPSIIKAHDAHPLQENLRLNLNQLDDQ